MAQPTITTFQKFYSGLIGGDINEKMGYGSNLTSFFKQRRQEWVHSEGYVKQKIQYSRLGIDADSEASFTDADNAAHPEPLKSNSTSNYGGSSSGGPQNTKNNVDPPVDTVTFKQGETGFGLLQKSFQSEDLSVEDFRAMARDSEQLDSMTNLLSGLAQEYWLRLYRDEFSRMSGNRFVALTGGLFTENGDVNECFDANQVARWNTYGFSNGTYDVAGTIDTPDKQNTVELDWNHLDELALRMLQEDPTGQYCTAKADGQPVCVLVTDAKTVRRLMTEAASGVRTDIRESSMADSLLKGLGVTHALNGWILLSDITPRKFTIVGDSADSSGATGTGTWSEQLFLSDGTRERVRNAAYNTADYTESYAFLPKGFTSFNPKPNYAGLTDAKFGPQDYSGDYSFEVIKDKTDNPWEAHGYYQGKIASANVAEEKDVLFTIRHRIGSGFPS